MTRRRGIVAASIAITAGAAVALAGCTGSSGSSGSQGQITLNFWTTTQQGAAATAIPAMVADFEKANPNITVLVTQKSTDALKTALRQAAGTSAAPDIFFQWSGLGLGGTYVKQGITLDLAKYYTQYKWADRFTPAAMASVKQYGGYQGVPYSADTEGIVYNKSLFAKAGITDLPTTYAQLTADAQKLKDAGITPIAFGGTVNWHLMRLLDNQLEAECGAATNDKLTGLKANWATTPCVTKSFTQLKDWADKYLNAGWSSSTDAQAQSLFYQHKVAMMLEGSWFNGFLKQNSFTPTSDLGLFGFPTGTDRVYGLTTNNYITKTSKNPDAAAKFLDFWTSPAVQKKYEGAFSAIPTVKGIDVTETGAGLASGFNDLAKNAKGAFQNNDQTFPLDVTTEYWRIMNGVATGSIAPGDAGKQLQTFVKNRS